MASLSDPHTDEAMPPESTFCAPALSTARVVTLVFWESCISPEHLKVPVWCLVRVATNVLVLHKPEMIQGRDFGVRWGWQPPKALKRPKTLVGPTGDKREDPYYWLRDDERENPEIIEHLKVWLLSGPGLQSDRASPALEEKDELPAKRHRQEADFGMPRIILSVELG